MSRLGFGASVGAGGVPPKAQIQGLIQQLSQQRTSQLGQIEKLFEQFGLSARQDITEQTAERSAQEKQRLITSGLGNTTIVGPRLGRIAREGAREKRRVGEQVARQKAGFLERQLIDPNTILNLIQQSSAAPDPRQKVQVRGPAGSRFGSSGIGTSSFGIRPSGQSAGVGGSSGARTLSGGNLGSAARGSRIITRRGSFSPGQFIAQRGSGRGPSSLDQLIASGAFGGGTLFTPQGGRSRTVRRGGSRRVSGGSGGGGARIIRRR